MHACTSKTGRDDQKKDEVDVDLEARDLEAVKAALKKAAELRDPRHMWTVVKEALDLLTLILFPE